MRKRKDMARGRFAKVRKVPLYNGGMGMLGNNVVDDDHNSKESFDKINGEKVLREYGPHGLRNAIHFIIT